MDDKVDLIKSLLGQEPADLSNEDNTCMICLCEYATDEPGSCSTPRKLPCGHIVGFECIINWAYSSPKNEEKCPYCRAQIANPPEADQMWTRDEQLVANLRVAERGSDWGAVRGGDENDTRLPPVINRLPLAFANGELDFSHPEHPEFIGAVLRAFSDQPEVWHGEPPALTSRSIHDVADCITTNAFRHYRIPEEWYVNKIVWIDCPRILSELGYPHSLGDSARARERTLQGNGHRLMPVPALTDELGDQDLYQNSAVIATIRTLCSLHGQSMYVNDVFNAIMGRTLTHMTEFYMDSPHEWLLGNRCLPNETLVRITAATMCVWYSNLNQIARRMPADVRISETRIRENEIEEQRKGVASMRQRMVLECIQRTRSNGIDAAMRWYERIMTLNNSPPDSYLVGQVASWWANRNKYTVHLRAAEDAGPDVAPNDLILIRPEEMRDVQANMDTLSIPYFLALVLDQRNRVDDPESAETWHTLMQSDPEAKQRWWEEYRDKLFLRAYIETQEDQRMEDAPGLPKDRIPRPIVPYDADDRRRARAHRVRLDDERFQRSRARYEAWIGTIERSMRRGIGSIRIRSG